MKILCDVTQIDKKNDYFYQSIRILIGLIIFHYWESKDGVVRVMSLLFKLVAIMLVSKKRKGAQNERSTLNLVIRIWRFDFQIGLGWHDDDWRLIL